MATQSVYTTYSKTRTRNPNQLEDTTSPRVYQQKKTIFRTYQVIWYIVGFIEILLLFRFILKLMGANLSGFTALVYGLSLPFALPFLGTFGSPAAGDMVFEWSTIIALIVYPILAYGIIKLMAFIKPTRPEEVEEKVEKV